MLTSVIWCLLEGLIMAVGSEQCRRERRSRVAGQFAAGHVEAALDLLHLMDMAWHDCYGPRELQVPPLSWMTSFCSLRGDLGALVRLARGAVLDFRDVRVAAVARRDGTRDEEQRTPGARLDG